MDLKFLPVLKHEQLRENDCCSGRKMSGDLRFVSSDAAKIDKHGMMMVEVFLHR